MSYSEESPDEKLRKIRTKMVIQHPFFGVLLLKALRAYTVAEGGFGMLLDECFKLAPIAAIVADFFALMVESLGETAFFLKGGSLGRRF